MYTIKYNGQNINTHKMCQKELNRMSTDTEVIDHFMVMCLVAWPLNEHEAGLDLVSIETSLLSLCNLLLISMRTASLTREKQ